MELTESMEDYLRLVYELGLDGEEVRVSALAGRFGISAPSVTNMAKRLARSDLIRRPPCRGLTLTEDGRKATLGVVRRHRPVEFYLVEVLGYSGDEVHEEVEAREGERSPRPRLRLGGDPRKATRARAASRDLR